MPLELAKCDECCDIDAKFTCPKCEENLCQDCDAKRHKSTKMMLHKRYPYLGLTEIPSRFCSIRTHSEFPLTTYCETCEKIVCFSCYLTDHKIHKCTPIPLEIEVKKKGIIQSLTLLQEQVRIKKIKIEEIEKKLKNEKNELQEMEDSVNERKKLIEYEYDHYIFFAIINQIKCKEEKKHPRDASSFQGESAVTKAQKDGKYEPKQQKDAGSVQDTQPKINPFEVQYLVQPVKSWSLTSTTHLGCISDGEKLYLVDAGKSCINAFTANGNSVECKFPPLNGPGDIDIDENGIYIIDQKYVYILTLQMEIVSTFIPSPASSSTSNHLKVDLNRIFITLHGQDGSFFIYSKEGKLIKQIGTQGTLANQLYNPRGLAIDEKNLYICDFSNHRIQVVLKDEPYTWIRRWTNGKGAGQFKWPYCIRISEGVVYVGDYYSIQLFTCTGQFIQRIGGNHHSMELGKFTYPWGICVIKNMLYVSEYSASKRIQVFSRTRLFGS